MRVAVGKISGGKVPLDPGAERARGHGTAVPRQLAPAADQHHRRYGLNVIAGCERGLSVGVDFGEAQPRFEFLGRPLKNRRHGAAWTAPRGPKIDQQRQIAGAGMAIEMRCVEINRVPGK